MLSTPDLGHLTTSDYRRVYEPAEDSFLLLDALEADQVYLRDQVRPRLCIEVGSGSGVITAFLATRVLQSHKTQYLTTDINPHAILATRQTCSHNGLDSSQLTCVQTDLLDGLLGPRDSAPANCPQLDGQVDVLLFNPPYVVTPSSEVGSQGIEAAWAGGIDGREVLDRFLPLVPLLLSAHGVFYLVAIEPNRPADIIQHMDQCYGLIGHTVLKRKAGCEHLSILRFTRRSAVATE
ncbi:HemK methyltransferase member 2 [Dimargaris verticillata]|uniref:HemK methyltransferase member 2 n=1 Tax=Dimargaris verticillata TaxID=2761393 RepID=A0A9W8B9I6_9FUNG|nr:HemK methyltransferase member 2 [Dimargaris verticillata]